MYHKINIHKLSHAQIGKLLNGHRIRVKHGHGHEIHASEEQHKKIMKAHQKGCGTTIQLDPFQIQNHQHMRGHAHGGDLFSDAKNLFNKSKHFGEHTLAPILDRAGVLPKMDNKTADFFRSIGIGGALNPAGSGILNYKNNIFDEIHQLQQGYNPATYNPVSAHMNPAHLYNYGSALNPAGYGNQHNHAHHTGHGEGNRRKVGRPRGHGEGFFGDLAKGALKALAPVAINAGANFLKSKIGGKVGAKKGRRGHGLKGHKGRRGHGEGIGEDILDGIQKYAPLALSFI